MESKSELAGLAVLPCSHVFHLKCIRAALGAIVFCPEFRIPMEQKPVASIVMELKPPPPREAVQRPSKPTSMAWKRHGFKLNAVAQRLKTIRADDPAGKDGGLGAMGPSRSQGV